MGVCLIIRTSGGTDTSGATATAARVLSGYTCYVNDVKITGTMTNQGTKTASLNAGGSYTIPAGYHSGSGKVTANALSGQTSGTATAARILSGRTAWVNGSKLTGTMTNRGAISQKLAANGSYTVPAGWHNGSGKVTQSLTTQGAKNVTPTTSNQTACAASRWTTGSIVILGSSNLKAANIKKGVKIFGVTGTWTGWVDSTVTLYNRSNKFNSVNNMKYFGSKSGSVSIYPSFESVDGVWTVRLPMRKSGSTYYARLWFWFYDQIGKTPYIDTIEPWFWWLNVSSTYDEVETSYSLLVIDYPGTSKYSVSEIQEKYKSETKGGDLQSGAPSFTGDYYSSTGDVNRMKVTWYVPEDVPKKPGYSVKLTWKYTSDSDYIWTGQVRMYCSWSRATSPELHLDRINYHPVK